jgi:predicted RNA-binding protein with PIN domain
MSKPIVILDAWNVIHRVPRLRRHRAGGPEGVRKALVSFCAEWLSKRRDMGQFWIVFDGGAPAYDDEPVPRVRVIHSGPSLKADDTIVMLVERHVRDLRLIVVSDDNEVAGRCRQLGAETRATGEFIDTLEPAAPLPARHGRPGQAESDAKNALSPAQEKAINEELKKAWGIK